MRFVVRSVDGWRIQPGHSRRTGNINSGLTVWVADEMFLGREVRIWQSEETRKHGRGAKKKRWMLAEAQRYADELNAQEAIA